MAQELAHAGPHLILVAACCQLRGKLGAAVGCRESMGSVAL